MASVVMRSVSTGAFLSNKLRHPFNYRILSYTLKLITGIISRLVSRKCRESILEPSKMRGAL